MLFSISKDSFPRIQGQLMRMTGVISGVVTLKDKEVYTPNELSASICPPGYYHNGFVATYALWDMMCTHPSCFCKI